MTTTPPLRHTRPGSTAKASMPLTLVTQEASIIITLRARSVNSMP